MQGFHRGHHHIPLLNGTFLLLFICYMVTMTTLDGISFITFHFHSKISERDTLSLYQNPGYVDKFCGQFVTMTSTDEFLWFNLFPSS